MSGFDHSGSVQLVDFDCPEFDDPDALAEIALDEQETTTELRPLPPGSPEAALMLMSDLIRWAGGRPERCAVVAKLAIGDSRSIARIARDSDLDRFKVHRAYESGRETLRALRSAHKQTL